MTPTICSSFSLSEASLRNTSADSEAMLAHATLEVVRT
jgi:hypothetical protein